MLQSLAPMEGITGSTFRQAHARCFGAFDRYYTPFVAPPRVGNAFGGKALRELDPDCNEGLYVTPQLLTKNADEFVWAARLLADMGYREVNLNLGCPSGTVVSKGKGSGFLRNLDELDAFLGEICERLPLPVSVKTRLGVSDDAEFGAVLEVYCRHPLAEIIVHPRVREDFYKGAPRWEPYGDVFAPRDMAALLAAHPATRHVMVGRGVLANPALPRVLRGGAPLSRDEVDRAVSFYAEMVDDRVEAGASEEEAVGSLEPPAEAAARIISETPAVPRAAARLRSPETPRSWFVAFVVAAVIGSPVWIPLALGVVMAVIGCFVCLFGLLVAVWAIAASALLGAPVGLLYLVVVPSDCVATARSPLVCACRFPRQLVCHFVASFAGRFRYVCTPAQ